jgi:predicted acetyltransferase
MTVTLKAAGEDDRPILENLMQLYIHDFSEFTQEEIDSTGRYDYPYLTHYWKDSHRYPHLIYADDKLAGFALVRCETDPENNQSNMDMSEFFVIRSFRRTGVGSEAATKIWDTYPGRWHLKVLRSNKPAYPFWKGLIASRTENKFEELNGTSEFLFVFHI